MNSESSNMKKSNLWDIIYSSPDALYNVAALANRLVINPQSESKFVGFEILSLFCQKMYAYGYKLKNVNSAHLRPPRNQYPPLTLFTQHVIPKARNNYDREKEEAKKTDVVDISLECQPAPFLCINSSFDKNEFFWSKDWYKQANLYSFTDFEQNPVDNARDPRVFVLDLVEHWLLNYMTNWAHVDLLCMGLLSFQIPHHPKSELDDDWIHKSTFLEYSKQPRSSHFVIDRLHSWSVSPEFWVKRGSLVPLVKHVRNSHQVSTSYVISSNVMNYPETLAQIPDLHQKAAGWVLRESMAVQPEKTINFIKKYPFMPRTCLRYTIERLDASLRNDLLATTRVNKKRPKLPKGVLPASSSVK